MAKKNKHEAQVAALPIRMGIDGKPQVLLITSRETGRWVIPKGWPMSDRSDPKAALQEAFEEAGVKGQIVKKPVGTYRYVKIMPKGTDDLDVEVTVYLLTVDEELRRWPEKDERIRDWVSPKVAASRVDEKELRDILLTLSIPDRLAS